MGLEYAIEETTIILNLILISLLTSISSYFIISRCQYSISVLIED